LATPKSVIVDVLRDMAVLIELSGGNPFRARSFANAARTLESYRGDFAALVASNGLTSIKGIGDSLSAKILELWQTGAMSELEELRKQIPPGLFDMLRIPGLGPKRIHTIHTELGVATIGELEYACQENRLALLAGFGAKLQTNILEGIRTVRLYSARVLYPKALRDAVHLKSVLSAMSEVVRCEVAGSLRRRRETIKDIDLVVTARASDASLIMHHFVQNERVAEIIAHGERKSSIRLDSGIQADLRVVEPGQFAAALMYFTGSKEHNIEVRGRAQQLGYKLNEYGLFPADDPEAPVSCANEDEIYAALGLSYIPPELREGRGEVEASAQHQLPVLLRREDVRGTFHVHTQYSDGEGTIADIARMAEQLGFEYVGIADHSQSAAYAGGLKPERLLEQIDEIDRHNAAQRGPRILKGIESDIRQDGTLDYDDDLLAKLDFVIASIHSSLKMDRETMTRRLMTAMSHPAMTALGHPTGRLLLGREPYEADFQQVYAEAIRRGIAIELNAHPMRLDIDWREIRAATECGAKIMINPDAHAPADMSDVDFGVGIARKGWLTPTQTVNALPLEAISQFLKGKKI